MSEPDLGNSFDMGEHRPFLRDGKAYVTRRNGLSANKELPSSDGVFFSVKDWMQMDAFVMDTVRPILTTCREFDKAACCVTTRLDDDAPFINKGAKQNCIADAARVVAEKVERILLGVDEPLVFKGTRYCGLCNHPSRNAVLLTDPYKDNERNPQWSLELFYSELARAESMVLGYSNGTCPTISECASMICTGICMSNTEDGRRYVVYVSTIKCERNQHES